MNLDLLLAPPTVPEGRQSLDRRGDGALILDGSPRLPWSDRSAVSSCVECGSVAGSKLANLLQRHEVGAIVARGCSSCARTTTHHVLPRRDLVDDELMVEHLVDAFRRQGVLVRHHPKDSHAYGVQVNRYHDFGGDHEVMLFGPITDRELVVLLRRAHNAMTLPDEAFYYRDAVPGVGGVWFPSPDRESRFGVLVTHSLLAVCHGTPESGDPNRYPPLMKFATDLAKVLTPTEREAVGLVLADRDGELTGAHQAALSAAFGAQAPSLRAELPTVAW